MRRERCYISAIATPSKATANCAAWRWSTDRYHRAGRLDQEVDVQMAAPGKREVLHDDRFEPTDGRRGPYRLPRTDPLDGRRFRFRGTRRLYASHPVRSCPSWKYGGSEIHAGCFDSEILSGLISSMRAVEASRSNPDGREPMGKPLS